ncbi:hypothetical protein [Microbacterium sp. gxy059]|uniref:hypothetical protein n=1 Tax=Microbacterium sp. gxy059 TaxID=2957199 RepID=UPI003D991C46
MNRDDYHRNAVLDSTLRDFDAAVERAEARALDRLSRKGFRFTTIAQARAHLTTVLRAARAQSELAAETAAWTDNARR